MECWDISKSHSGSSCMCDISKFTLDCEDDNKSCELWNESFYCVDRTPPKDERKQYLRGNYLTAASLMAPAGAWMSTASVSVQHLSGEDDALEKHEQSPIHADRYTSIVTYRIPECKAYGKFLAQTRNVRSRSNCGVKTSIRIYVICTHNTGQAPSVMCLKSYSLEAKY